jgi:hypothetical protein
MQWNVQYGQYSSFFFVYSCTRILFFWIYIKEAVNKEQQTQSCYLLRVIWTFSHPFIFSNPKDEETLGKSQWTGIINMCFAACCLREKNHCYSFYFDSHGFFPVTPQIFGGFPRPYFSRFGKFSCSISSLPFFVSDLFSFSFLLLTNKQCQLVNALS